MKLKSLVAALALGAAATGANAAINDGATGNGELFVNLVTADSSYVRDLGLSLDDLNTAIGAAGAVNLTWTADALLTSWLSTAVGPIEMSVFGVDSSGQRRFVSTFASAAYVAKTNDVVRNSVTAVQTKLASINPSLPGATESATFLVGTAGYTGTNNFNDTVSTSNANNLGFDASSADMYDVLGMRTVFANATGIVASTTSIFADTTLTAGPLTSSLVQAYFSAGDNTFHIAAIDNVTAPIPEPETYAMLLAGLGMIGFMARRRLGNQA